MRLLSALFASVLLSGLAAAQATTMAGTASNWAPAYGVYVAPFVPLVITPKVSLQPLATSPAGASNTAFGNVAGASNATLSIVSEPPVGGIYDQPVWYGPSPAPEVAVEARPHPKHEKKAIEFDFFVGSRQSTESASRLMASAGTGKKASRTYTNQDIDRVNQTNGSAKWDGKTEHL